MFTQFLISWFDRGFRHENSGNFGYWTSKHTLQPICMEEASMLCYPEFTSARSLHVLLFKKIQPPM